MKLYELVDGSEEDWISCFKEEEKCAEGMYKSFVEPNFCHKVVRLTRIHLASWKTV